MRKLWRWMVVMTAHNINVLNATVLCTYMAKMINFISCTFSTEKESVFLAFQFTSKPKC
jgi:hypothetical protein